MFSNQAQAKVISLFLGSLLILTGVLAWRSFQLLKTEQKSAIESQLRSQTSYAISSIESELQSVIKNLDLLDWNSSLKNSLDLEMAAKVFMPGSQGPNWKIENQIFKDNSVVKDWAPTYLELLFKKSSESELRTEHILVYTLPDPQKKPYIVVMNKSVTENYVYVAVLKSTWLQKLMDRSKGENTTLRVINQQGQVVGHPTLEYVGSSLREDALVENLMNSQVGTGSGNFETLEGSVYGQYEQVGTTNLFVTLTVPSEVLYKNKKVIFIQLLLIGAGVSFLAFALYLLLDKEPNNSTLKTGTQNNILPQATPQKQMAPTEDIAIKQNSAKTTNGSANQTPLSMKEKMNIYTKVASGLSHELKTPLMIILGQVKLLKSQVNANANSDPNSKTNMTLDEQSVVNLNMVEKIESEARLASELIQKLVAFSGEDHFKPTKSNIEALLTRALKSLDGKILGKGIKLKKNISPLPEVFLSPELFLKAIAAILENSIEAMDRTSKKELLVQAQEHQGEIIITVQDSGEGISAENISKIFDPFFTTRSHQNHVGLGLSTAQGILKELNGDIKIESVPLVSTMDSTSNYGTTVTIKILPNQSIGEILHATQLKPTEVMTTPSTPNLIVSKPNAMSLKTPTPIAPLQKDSNSSDAAKGTVATESPLPELKVLKVPELNISELNNDQLLSDLMDANVAELESPLEIESLDFKEPSGGTNSVANHELNKDLKTDLESEIKSFASEEVKNKNENQLIDDSIEKMMEDLDMEVNAERKNIKVESEGPQKNVSEIKPNLTLDIKSDLSVSQMSSSNQELELLKNNLTLDPQIINKKSKLDQVQVQIRRPGKAVKADAEGPNSEESSRSSV